MHFKAVTNDRRRLDLNWDAINTYLSRWRPGTPIDVTIVRKQKKKSDPMRKYYWSTVLPPFLEELGYEKDEDELVHTQLKITYFRVKPDERGIYRPKTIPSVFGDDSDLGVPKKKAFLDWVVRKAAEYGVYIPDPNEGQ